MSTPATAPTFVQGLLQSLQPWMTGSSPSALDNSFAQYGGTQGLIDAMLQDSPGSQGAAAYGRALEGVQNDALQRAASRQQLAQQGLGLQLMGSKMPAIEAYYRMLGAMMGANGGQPQGVPSGSQTPPGTPGASPVASTVSAASPGAPQGSPGVPVAAQSAMPIPQTGIQQSAAPGAPQASPGGFWSNPAGVMKFGALGSALGLPGGQQFFDYGKTALQYDPATANRLAVAKNQVSQDLTQLYQAYASGNPTAIQGMQTKLKTDMGMLHVGSMSGILTRQNPDGSWTTINPSTGLTTNTKTGSQFLPGAIEAFAARQAAESGAAKRAQLQAAAAPIGAAPAAPGSASPASKPAAAAQGNPGGIAALQTPGFVPDVLAQSGETAQRPGSTGGEELVEFQKKQAEKASTNLEEMKGQAASAQQVLTQAQQIEEAATEFTPEKYADIKGELLSALQPLGVLSPDQLKSLGSYQDASKLTIQLQTMLTKSLGSREAAQVFEKLGKAVPGLTLSPDGLVKIGGYLKGIARWQIAQSTFGQRLGAQGNVGGVNNLQENFETHSNPAYYILASSPPDVRAELIRNSPNPKALMADWQQAAEAGLAPGPSDYEGF